MLNRSSQNASRMIDCQSRQPSLLNCDTVVEDEEYQPLIEWLKRSDWESKISRAATLMSIRISVSLPATATKS
jgi:hypothetical protein